MTYDGSESVDQNLLLAWWFLCCCGETVSSRVVSVLHHQETLSAGLLNSVKKEEACVINIRRGINVTHLSVQMDLFVQHPRQRQEVHENCTMFSTTDLGWKIYHDELYFPCKMHLSQPLTGA
jgi:hypothetical protein